MSENGMNTIEEVMAGKDNQKMSRHGWVGFVESDVVNFMTQHDIEKMTLDDGTGNKAKLTRVKDHCIKVECTSSNIL